MIDISVIIPIFNTGEKLKKTIQSVLNQSFENFELILVNDGSTDQSKMICDFYNKVDTRIVVINQKNAGLCAARNTGIKAAQGQYISFLDHDDEYDSNLLKDNYCLAKKYDAEIVKFGYEYIDFNLAQKRIERQRKSRTVIDRLLVIKKQELGESYPCLCENKILTYIWDGLYKKSFVDQYNFEFDTRYSVGSEDIAFSMSVYPHINVFVYNPKIYYHYYVYKESTYNGMKKEKFLQYISDVFYTLNIEGALFEELGIQSKQGDYWEYRKLQKIIDTVAFIWERSKDIPINEMKQYLYQIDSFVDFGAINLKRGLTSAKFKQKVIIFLFYHKKFYILASILKIHIKLKHSLDFFVGFDLKNKR